MQREEDSGSASLPTLRLEPPTPGSPHPGLASLQRQSKCGSKGCVPHPSLAPAAQGGQGTAEMSGRGK